MIFGGGGEVATTCGISVNRPRRMALALTCALALLAAAVPVAQAKPQNSIDFTCKTIWVRYTGFPAEGTNKVHELVRIDRTRRAVDKVFTFEGPEAIDAITINLPPGHHALDVFAIWKGGHHDQPLAGGITCTPRPEMTVEKLQRFPQGEFTSEGLSNGEVGQTVEYEIVVR